MGTVCRIGIAGLFIGNTAESILGEVSYSVLTLKPDGFETPVK
jgi:universal stress protein E